ncbi:MAG TPA: CAP domain-containing protein [Dehalococcoidia bacterium]|nr:CAP domain-containing protein [Dehalococcoidia bacterium]
MKLGGGVVRWLRVAALAVFLAFAAIGTTIVGSPRQAAALDGEETAVLNLINQYRAANGLGTLSIDGTLDTAARWMSDDMANNNYFSHTDSLGRDPFVRLGDFGYTYNTWKGENLAAGIDTAQEAFDLWKGSPGHNANLLNPSFTVIGIARSYNSASTFGWYWATDFGGQGDPAPPPAPPPPPPPAPAPPPPAASVETPPPTPEPTPEPTLAPTPQPSPEPVKPIGWEGRVWLRPWWDRLTLVAKDGSALRSVFFLAGRLLDWQASQLVSGSAPSGTRQFIRPEQLWPTTFS